MNYKLQIRLLALFLSFIIYNLAFIIPVHAQAPTPPAVNVTLSPIFFDLTATPSGILKDKIRIKNNADSPMALQIDIKKIITDQSGSLSIQDPTSNDDYINWLRFTTTHFVAAPGQWTDLPFTLTVPDSAAFAYYYAVTFKADTSTGNGNGAALSGQLAVPILLAIKKPGTLLNGQIVDFKTSSFINEYLPVNFQTVFKNTGNVHIKPHGNIFIQSHGQNDIAILDVNNTLGNVLPGASRTFLSDWTDGFMVREPVLDATGQPTTDKNGQPITKLTFHWDKLTHMRIGPYSAHLVLVFDNGQRDQVLESSTTFWVFPYKIIIGVLIVIIGSFLLIRKAIRSYIQTQIRKGRR
jgi:hypothetical protein